MFLQPTRFLRIVGLLVFSAVALGGRTASAKIIWDWSFAGTEAGTFTSDGDLVGGLAPAGTYVFDDFEVTASGFAPLGSVSGNDYFETLPDQGIIWDGTQATQFFRSSGSLTNGILFNSIATDHIHLFDVNFAGLTTNTFVPTFASDVVVGAVLVPTAASQPPAVVTPEPSTLALCTILALSSIGYGFWRKRRSDISA